MRQLFQELKRRNVFRVAIAYLAVAWVVLQVADIVLESIAAPDWLMQALLFFIGIGFVFALFFAWAFEMTPEGLKKEAEVDRSASITHRTGKTLDRVIIGVLAIAVIFLLIDREPDAPSGTSTDTSGRSVAVLPFIAMSSGPDDEYFADGLTEEILNSLTRVQDLLVTARTSSFHFKGQDLPIPEIAATLGVAHIVEGSVRRDGERLRVTAQLIRTSDGFHLWSENYDRDSKNSFAVQTDIAEKIATALGVVLDDKQLERMHSAGLTDPEAFVAYQKGREFYQLAHGAGADSHGHLTEANKWLDRALALAPNLSNAHRLHTDLYAHTLVDSGYGDETSQEDLQIAYREMTTSFDNAIRTSSETGERLSTAYDRALLTGNWHELPGIFNEVAQLDACIDSGWMDVLSNPFGEAQRFLRLSLLEAECNPLNYSGWRSAALANLFLGNTDEAIRLSKAGIEKNPHVLLSNTLFVAYLAAGKFAEAESVIVRDIPGSAAQTPLRISLAAARGDEELVNALLKDFMESDDVDVENLIPAAAAAGNRVVANRVAADIDARPYGYLLLMQMPYDCKCGAPFDLEFTPNLAKLLDAAKLEWPTESPIDWPLKDW